MLLPHQRLIASGPASLSRLATRRVKPLRAGDVLAPHRRLASSGTISESATVLLSRDSFVHTLYPEVEFASYGERVGLLRKACWKLGKLLLRAA